MKKKLLFIAFFITIVSLNTNSFAEEKMKEKFPFFPSLINTSTGKPVKSTEFTEPKRCRGCHRKIYKQWNGSMHSNAFVDPVFHALWVVGAKETNGATDKFCAGCHTAIGTVSEEVIFDKEAGKFKASDIAEKGVQCDFCHTIKASTYLETPTFEPQNASLIMDPGDVKRGPYKDAKSPRHKCEYSELHTQSKFCGNCHHVFHPVTNFPIERTYDEWKHSVYAQNDIQCQDCHMMPIEQAIETAKTLKKQKNPGKASPMGPDREQVYTHEFVGGNFTVTALLGADKHAEIAVKRLQSAAKLEIIPPEEIKTNGLTILKVKVTNVGAGHNLPTSLTELRQVWLDVSVNDNDGHEIFRSGALDEEGELGYEAVIFNSVAVDKDGHHTFKPWEIARFESVNTIPPKGSSVEKYSFIVPEGAKGPLMVTAVLRYRSASQEIVNQLLGKDAPVLPIVDMAKKELEVNVE